MTTTRDRRGKTGRPYVVGQHVLGIDRVVHNQRVRVHGMQYFTLTSSEAGTGSLQLQAEVELLMPVVTEPHSRACLHATTIALGAVTICRGRDVDVAADRSP